MLLTILRRTQRQAWARLPFYATLSVGRAVHVPPGAQRAFLVSSRCADQGLVPLTLTASVTTASTDALPPLSEQKTTSSLVPTPFAEFIIGADLAFDHAIATGSAIIRVEPTIVHVYRPFTMSPVLRVRIVRAPGANLPSEVILKLYDRRCLNNVREEYDPPAMWSAEKDRQYAQWMQDLADGKVQPTNVDEENFSIYRYHLFGGRLEDFLQYEATDLYNQELESYNALAEFQGDLIPRLYGAVTYRDPSRCTVPGILIEYVPGLTMRQLIATWTSRTPRLPDSELARACEAAVAVVKRLAHTDILNNDVRIDNLMFRDEDSGARSPVVVIDLTHCQLRGSLTDEEWATRKHGTDEIGAAGQILNQNVREFVGPDVWYYYSGGHYWQPKP